VLYVLPLRFYYYFLTHCLISLMADRCSSGWGLGVAQLCNLSLFDQFSIIFMAEVAKGQKFDSVICL